MLRFVLLLAAAKPACDYVIRLLTSVMDEQYERTRKLIQQHDDMMKTMIMESRALAHDDAMSLHNEHVKIYRDVTKDGEIKDYASDTALRPITPKTLRARLRKV